MKKTPLSTIYKKDSILIHSLCTFGEIGIMHDAKKIQGKLNNHGKISMFVGYAADHTGNTFKMLNLDTKRIWQSRDVHWLAPSLLAYAALQLAQLKASKNDNDDNYEPQVKTNPPPPANKVDANNNVEDNDANEQDDDQDNEDDEEDDHPPTSHHSTLSPSKCQGYPRLKTVVYLLQSSGNKLCLPASQCG